MVIGPDVDEDENDVDVALNGRELVFTGSFGGGTSVDTQIKTGYSFKSLTKNRIHYKNLFKHIKHDQLYLSNHIIIVVIIIINTILAVVVIIIVIALVLTSVSRRKLTFHTQLLKGNRL